MAVVAGATMDRRLSSLLVLHRKINCPFAACFYLSTMERRGQCRFGDRLWIDNRWVLWIARLWPPMVGKNADGLFSLLRVIPGTGAWTERFLFHAIFVCGRSLSIS